MRILNQMKIESSKILTKMKMPMGDIPIDSHMIFLSTDTNDTSHNHSPLDQKMNSLVRKVTPPL